MASLQRTTLASFLTLIDPTGMKFVHSIAVYTIVCISYGQARIRPNDDQLTVFPDACNVDGDDDDAQGRASGNCGVQRLDQVGHSWLLRSDDGVYADIPSTVSTCMDQADFDFLRIMT